jgi:hypothetical protein
LNNVARFPVSVSLHHAGYSQNVTWHKMATDKNPLGVAPSMDALEKTPRMNLKRAIELTTKITARQPATKTRMKLGAGAKATE